MALCFFNSRGIACLVNRRMLWVSTQLLGSSVQTLSELERDMVIYAVDVDTYLLNYNYFVCYHFAVG